MKLLIVVEIDPACDPTTEDPHDVAQYVLDENADDPCFRFVEAEWEDNADMIVNSLGRIGAEDE